MTRALLGSPLARVLLLGALVLALQIPACMIGELGRERAQARDDAVAEVGMHWGGRQELIGPLLVVPYIVWGRDDKGRNVINESGHFVFTPERLQIAAATEVEARQRGLFRIPVYRSTVTLTGRFAAPATLAATLHRGAAVQWDGAQLVARLADVHAVDSATPLLWDRQAFSFEPGSGPLGGNGLHASLATLAADRPAAFEMSLAFRGSGGLYFAPAGLETTVSLSSPWPDPAFLGAWLPTRREVGPQGFTAGWSVPFVARGLPAAWKQGMVSEEQLRGALFGVDFLTPVDPYRMSERSLKYWPLFVGLAFLAVWLFEVLGASPVHPIQYLMVGVALCLFYLLELSLAEHLGFGLAYLLASAAVTLQVGLYSRSALQGRRPLLMLAATASLYALLYLLLRQDDYALLIGSASLFAVLSVVMYLTRRVRWSGDSGQALAGQ